MATASLARSSQKSQTGGEDDSMPPGPTKTVLDTCILPATLRHLVAMCSVHNTVVCVEENVADGSGRTCSQVCYGK